MVEIDRGHTHQHPHGFANPGKDLQPSGTKPTSSLKKSKCIPVLFTDQINNKYMQDSCLNVNNYFASVKKHDPKVKTLVKVPDHSTCDVLQVTVRSSSCGQESVPFTAYCPLYI